MRIFNCENCIFDDNSGFTLIEVIAVLVIIGILSIVVANRISSTSSDLYAVESAFKTHLRYAQSKAMHNNTDVWGIRMDTALNEYWLFQCNVGDSCGWTANRRLPPGGDAGKASLPDRIRTSLTDVDLSQVSIGGSPKIKVCLVFNDMGVPFWLEGANVSFLDPLSDTAGLTRASTDITIGLLDNNGNTRTITIASETGFVQ